MPGAAPVRNRKSQRRLGFPWAMGDRAVPFRIAQSAILAMPMAGAGDGAQVLGAQVGLGLLPHAGGRADGIPRGGPRCALRRACAYHC